MKYHIQKVYILKIYCYLFSYLDLYLQAKEYFHKTHLKCKFIFPILKKTNYYVQCKFKWCYNRAQTNYFLRKK